MMRRMCYGGRVRTRVNLSREVALIVGPGGWSYYSAPGLGAEVRVRLGIAEGSRIEVQELHLLRPSAIELRNIPLGRIETAVNAPSVRDEVYAAIAAGTARDQVVEYTVATETDSAGEVSRRLSALAPKEGRGSAHGSAIVSARATGRRGPRRLRIPTGRKRPDSFYREVADAYSELAGSVRNPAAQLAEANDVPTSTVYRWLKEARARGILAPRSRTVEASAGSVALAGGTHTLTISEAAHQEPVPDRHRSRRG